ncbi:MAG: hypothetical protein AAF583_04220 [Pseudomonadota bacterium]
MAVVDESVERRSIAPWWVKLPMQNVARCYNLDPRGHVVSLAVPEHFESRPDPVERAMWKFSNERRKMACAQDVGLMLEPTAGGVQ